MVAEDPPAWLRCHTQRSGDARSLETCRGHDRYNSDGLPRSERATTSTRGCPPPRARVKPTGIVCAKVQGVIRILLVATAILAIFIGVGIGLSARSIVGDKPAPNDPVSGLPTPAMTPAPTLAPPN